MSTQSDANNHWHRRLERNTTLFTVLVTVAILIGGLVELIPLYQVHQRAEDTALVEPYTPLEAVGRDIYVREGCYNCHSQMIRPLHAEVLRYGEWSRSAEYAYDRPFQLGSRRIGPDLAREGGLRTNAWHWEHFWDPRAVVPGSIMPAYKWLYRRNVDVDDARATVRALRRLGTPYTEDHVDNVERYLREQGQAIVDDLATQGIEARWDQEIIAMIAYMQVLGTHLPALLGEDAPAPAPAGEAPGVDAPETAAPPAGQEPATEEAAADQAADEPALPAGEAVADEGADEDGAESDTERAPQDAPPAQDGDTP